jgi:hypothetical protein
MGEVNVSCGGLIESETIQPYLGTAQNQVEDIV